MPGELEGLASDQKKEVVEEQQGEQQHKDVEGQREANEEQLISFSE